MEKLKNKSGITLIALIITIIVLLILAGVSIATITSDDGVVKQAANATEQTESKGNKEKIQLAVQEYKISKLSGENVEESLEDIINNGGYGTAYYDPDLGVTVVQAKGSDEQYNVSDDGNIVEKTEESDNKLLISNALKNEEYVDGTKSLSDVINETSWGTAEYDSTLNTTVVTITESGKKYNVSSDGTITENTIDVAWYNDSSTSFTITSVDQLLGLSVLVNNGNSFAGKTIVLGSDMNFSDKTWMPIGNNDNRFSGTFDGNNHTIKGMNLNGWEMGYTYRSDKGLGLFGYVENATVKNLKVDNVEIVMEGVTMAPVAAYAYGNSVFDNITVSNAKVANYNDYSGSIVGWAEGTQTYSNINVKDSVTISSLWGTYDCGVGGLIGGIDTSTIVTVENCNVAAKLDVFNDACANYQYFAYRYTGMLIGDTGLTTKRTNEDGSTTTIADASNVTFSNCTVTYGDWANYTYCEFESAGKPSYAGEGEWKYQRLEAGYAYDGIDVNHEHDTDETHAITLTVDQLFGGATGVYGNPSAEGVEVIYNY